MASLKLQLALLLVAVAVAASGVRGADPDPIDDFCVADLTNTNLFVNGLPCKKAASVTSADFRSQLFRAPANTTNALGIALNIAAGATFPALNTQGLTLVKIDYDKTGGFVPPHVHPRASEVIYVLEGSVLVGFVDTSGNYYSSTLYAGDLFVFPRGLIHFQLGLSSPSCPSLSLSALNSQNPGLQLVASALFGSTPGIPDVVLEKTLALTAQQVATIRKAFGK